jgi:hypothetical protein
LVSLLSEVAEESVLTLCSCGVREPMGDQPAFAPAPGIEAQSSLTNAVSDVIGQTA